MIHITNKGIGVGVGDGHFSDGGVVDLAAIDREFVFDGSVVLPAQANRSWYGSQIFGSLVKDLEHCEVLSGKVRGYGSERGLFRMIFGAVVS